ncbi:MAG: hypothetical protein ACW98X_01290 [Promethearchaeota archaeon]
MTEEKTEQIEEKEEKRKIKVISVIDDKIAIQGQSFMKGQLKDALDLAYDIIDLAKTENLTSFIREQEQLISRINGLIKQREEKEREKVRAELESEFKKLENNYNEAFEMDDFVKLEQVIRDAKKHVIQSNEQKLKIKWENLENKYLESRARKEIVKDITKLIKDSTELRKNYQFEDLKLRLTYLMQQVQEKELDEYKDKLEEIRRETIAAEDSYNQVKKNIIKLKETILSQKDAKDYKKAITNCENLIQQAESIEDFKEVKEFSQELTHLKDELKFEELKAKILNLNTQGITLLKKGAILDSVEKFETIRVSLKEWV